MSSLPGNTGIPPATPGRAGVPLAITMVRLDVRASRPLETWARGRPARHHDGAPGRAGVPPATAGRAGVPPAITHVRARCLRAQAGMFP